MFSDDLDYEDQYGSYAPYVPDPPQPLRPRLVVGLHMVVPVFNLVMGAILVGPGSGILLALITVLVIEGAWRYART